MFSRLNATSKVTNPTTTDVTTNEFNVARSVRLGMAQSALIVLERVDLQFWWTYRAKCQGQIEDADICKQHYVLPQACGDSAFGDRCPGEFLNIVSSNWKRVLISVYNLQQLFER